MSSKIPSINLLIGATITAVKQRGHQELDLLTHGKRYTIVLEDEGAGGNDSYASFKKVKLNGILNQPITKVYEAGGDSYGCTLTLRSADGGVGHIVIKHEHNGYYGFSYEVTTS